jgi:predicted anti-sigma-YlaC factor YlaD
MNNLSCEEAREALQDAPDGEGLLAVAVRSHLDGCPDCQRFESFLSTLGGRLRGELDKASADMAAPAVARLTVVRKTRLNKRRLVAGVSGLAAALVIAAGGLVSARLVRDAEIRESVRQETGLFIDDLFSDPVLADVDVAGLGEPELP